MGTDNCIVGGYKHTETFYLINNDADPAANTNSGSPNMERNLESVNNNFSNS